MTAAGESGTGFVADVTVLISEEEDDDDDDNEHKEEDDDADNEDNDPPLLMGGLFSLCSRAWAIRVRLNCLLRPASEMSANFTRFAHSTTSLPNVHTALVRQ
jgi:hypothetical protein